MSAYWVVVIYLMALITYNVRDGYLEGLVHGYRNGLLRAEDYANLCQCDSLEDMKLHLSGTDYGNFLQNESGGLNVRVITEAALDKLVTEFNDLRTNANGMLSSFLDFVSYEYMIANVLKLITGARNGRETLELMYKCHPLGLFDSIGALTSATSIDDMYESVLVDSPIGRFFTRTDKRDFDEFSMEYIRSLLYKNWLEQFYDLATQQIGGDTSEVMANILEFEADRTVITITRNTYGVKELGKDERMKLYPNLGQLVDIHDELAAVDDDDQLKDILKPYVTIYDMFIDAQTGGASASGASPPKSLEGRFLQASVDNNKDAFSQQFQFGIFYSYVKLKEQEINNLMWIAECINQGMKHRINEYVTIF